MMYPFSSYSYSFYGSEATFLVIAILAAIILGVVLYFTFLNKKNEGKYKGATEKIYNFFNFNKFYVEDVMKLLYIVSAAVLTVTAIVILFAQSFLAGLMLLVLGNVALRISYELIMMFIILCRKTVSVDKKLDKITKFYGDDFDEFDFDEADFDDANFDIVDFDDEEINGCESCPDSCESCPDSCESCPDSCESCPDGQSECRPDSSEAEDKTEDDSEPKEKDGGKEDDSEPKEKDGGKENIKPSER